MGKGSLNLQMIDSSFESILKPTIDEAISEVRVTDSTYYELVKELSSKLPNFYIGKGNEHIWITHNSNPKVKVAQIKI